MVEARNSPRRVTARIKRARAVQLKMGGLSYQQIADSHISPDDPRPLFSSRQRAFEAVKIALAQVKKETEESAGELRSLELERLDALHMSLWPATRPSRSVTCDSCGAVMWREPDLGAVGRVLEISKQRSTLTGMNAADETEERAVTVLEQQVALAHQAMVGAMARAGIPPDKQREVLAYATDILREAEAADEG